MRKFITLTIVAIFATSFSTAFAQQNSRIYDKGVVINGVKWATRNVDAVGTFADVPESAGKFYQWNRKKAWNTTDSIVSGWDSTIPEGNTWEKANDPSPKGWRVPTLDEIKKLLDKTKVSNVWTTQNGVEGRLFVDLQNGNKLFLSAAGYRGSSDGTLRYVGAYGYYWSSTQVGSNSAYSLGLGSVDAGWGNDASRFGYCVRPVSE